MNTSSEIPSVLRVLAKMDEVHTSCAIIGYALAANPKLTYDDVVLSMRELPHVLPPGLDDPHVVPNKFERRVLNLMCCYNLCKDAAIRIIEVENAFPFRPRPPKEEDDALAAEKRTKQECAPPDVPIPIDDDLLKEAIEELKDLIGDAEEEFKGLKSKLEKLLMEGVATIENQERETELVSAMYIADVRIRNLKSELRRYMIKAEPAAPVSPDDLGLVLTTLAPTTTTTTSTTEQ